MVIKNKKKKKINNFYYYFIMYLFLLVLLDVECERNNVQETKSDMASSKWISLQNIVQNERQKTNLSYFYTGERVILLTVHLLLSRL